MEYVRNEFLMTYFVKKKLATGFPTLLDGFSLRPQTHFNTQAMLHSYVVAS